MKCLKMQVQIEMFIADELDVFELPAQAWSIKCTHPFFFKCPFRYILHYKNVLEVLWAIMSE